MTVPGPARRASTAITLGTLLALVLVIGLWGLHELTKPFPGRKASATPSCSAAEKSRTTFVKAADVTVSVYNAGARQGFAALTLERLERRGFHPGEVGNAPKGTKVVRAKVLTADEHDPAAKLVARNLGKGVRVEVVSQTYGPGIDVLVGPKMHLLNPDGPARVRLAHPVTDCVPVE